MFSSRSESLRMVAPLQMSNGRNQIEAENII
jgi:hypothetical protein